jgi:hypothetical protein
MGDPSGKGLGARQGRRACFARSRRPRLEVRRTFWVRKNRCRKGRAPWSGIWGPATEPPRSAARANQAGTASNLPCAGERRTRRGSTTQSRGVRARGAGAGPTSVLDPPPPLRPPGLGCRAARRAGVTASGALGESPGRSGRSAPWRPRTPPRDVRRAGSPVHRGRSRSRCVPEARREAPARYPCFAYSAIPAKESQLNSNRTTVAKIRCAEVSARAPGDEAARVAVG